MSNGVDGDQMTERTFHSTLQPRRSSFPCSPMLWLPVCCHNCSEDLLLAGPSEHSHLCLVPMSCHYLTMLFAGKEKSSCTMISLLPSSSFRCFFSCSCVLAIKLCFRRIVSCFDSSVFASAIDNCTTFFLFLSSHCRKSQNVWTA